MRVEPIVPGQPLLHLGVGGGGVVVQDQVHGKSFGHFPVDGASPDRADRSRWNTSLIAEGVAVLQTALGRDRLGEFQAQAAIAALHADAARAEETDWAQIVGWYDELLRLTESPVVQLNRAIAIGEADGPVAGLAALATVDPGLPRHTARLGVPPRESGRHSDRGTVVCRCRPVRPPTSPNVTTSRQAARINQALRG